MDIGRMDRRLTIYSPTSSGDTFGGAGAVTTYTTIAATVWARQILERSDTAWQAAEFDGTTFATFRIRYRTDLRNATGYRFTTGGLTYEIVGVLELGRREGLDLKCKAHL